MILKMRRFKQSSPKRRVKSCFGTARLVENDAEKRAALEAFADKYFTSNGRKKNLAEIECKWKIVRVFAIDVEPLAGKASMELVQSCAKKGSQFDRPFALSLQNVTLCVYNIII